MIFSRRGAPDINVARRPEQGPLVIELGDRIISGKMGRSGNSAHMIGQTGEDHVGVVIVDSKSRRLVVKVIPILKAGGEIFAEVMREAGLKSVLLVTQAQGR